VGAPIERIGRATLRLHSSAPLIGEEQLGSIVVERRGVPVREVRVCRGVETNWMRRIADVEQQAVAAAGTARSANRRIQRDVVALAGPGPRSFLVWIHAHHFVDDTLKITAQRCTVRGSRRAGPTASLDDLRQLSRDETIRCDL